MKLSGVFLAALTLMAACATSAFAQGGTPPLVPIQGIVLDKVSRSPISGARVNAVAINGATPTVGNATSDGSGQFSLSIPGGMAFSLSAYATGYQGSQLRQPAPGQTSIFVEIALERLGEIRGRLIDDDTKMPIAGVGVALVRPEERIVVMGSLGMQREPQRTQEDGSFVFKDLDRGQYYVRVQSSPTAVMQEIPAKDLAPETRDKALEVPKPAEGYGNVVWPGGEADTSKAPPLELTSEVLDIGDIRLRRYKLHNLSGVLGACAEGAYLQMLVLAKNGGGSVRLADLDTKCGNGFRLLNLPNGAFTVVAQGGPPRMFTSETIDGAATRGPLFLNVSGAVAVQILIEVEGVAQTDFPQDLQNVRIGLTPENAPTKIDPPDRAAPWEYEAHLFGNERYRLSAIPPPTYYVKEVSYNGVALADSTSFTAVPARSMLRLVLSKHPGKVEVQAPGGRVFLWKEDAKLTDPTVVDQRVIQQVGADGKAHFAGLSPGRYRAFLAGEMLPTTQAVLDEGLGRSTEVTVEEGQTSSVVLN